MIAGLLGDFANLPDVWGEGALFAFSGMDGETESGTGFTASFTAQPYGLLFHLPARRTLQIQLEQPGRVYAATGDVLAVETPGGDLLITYPNWHTLTGCLPSTAHLALSREDGTALVRYGDVWLSEDTDHGDVLALAHHKNRFALAYGQTREIASLRAVGGLACDLDEITRWRLELYRLPILEDAGRDRLLKKCISVMRVNTLSAEGLIAQSWSTPDRVPHRHMWLWDSAFHSFAMNLVDPALSWEFLKSVLEAQQPDGMIPHMITADGRTSRITQPPILAWAVWENYQELQDPSTLAFSMPYLERYLEWDCAHRDHNGNGLLEWFIEGDVNCRSGESGLDNSPRFDDAVLLDAVDFSVFAAQDMASLSQIASALGDHERAAVWQARAKDISAKVHELLWDEQTGFYDDRGMDGCLTGVMAATGFLPLLLPDIPPERAARLVLALQDPRHFNTAFPVPSVSASHPAYSTDMWRGATWVNLNYLIVLGLARCGFEEESAWLAEKTIGFVDKYYRQYGVLFEFFDSSDRRPPLACDRKGARVAPYDIRRKYDSIRDYHWTAALTACMLLEREEHDS